jgi:hypothetical protein
VIYVTFVGKLKKIAEKYNCNYNKRWASNLHNQEKLWTIIVRVAGDF